MPRIGAVVNLLAGEDWLDIDSLSDRARFADHSRETFDAVLDTCERIAREKYAPFNRLVDTQEPHFDGEKVILPQATFEAQKAYAATARDPDAWTAWLDEWKSS